MLARVSLVILLWTGACLAQCSNATLATGVFKPNVVAVDSTSVYFGDQNGNLYKVPKNGSGPVAPTLLAWAGADFNGPNAPTSLDGVKVTIGGQAAFIDYVSPTQVNAQVPSNLSPGQTQVTLTTAAGTSSPYTITVSALDPGLLAPAAFKVGAQQYVTAQFSDGTFVLPPNALAGTATRQAKPGETVIIYGVGFGPVLTTSNANIPAGQVVSQANQLANALVMQIGGVTAAVSYAGLAPDFVGLYQFNVVVPAVPDGGAAPLTFTLNGVKGTQTLYTAVHQ